MEPHGAGSGTFTLLPGTGLHRAVRGWRGMEGGRVGPRRGRGQGLGAWPGPGAGRGGAGRGRGRATYSGCSRRLQARLSRPDCSLRRRSRALRTLDSGSDTRGGAWKAGWGPCAFNRGPPRAPFGAAASQPAPSRPRAL